MKRLASLDILRGFDLFLLLFVGPMVSSLAAVSDAEWTNSLAYHFDHAAWDGLHMWDLVMPLFMFMAGVSNNANRTKAKIPYLQSAFH